MKAIGVLLFGIVAAVPAQATGLSFTLSPNTQIAYTNSYPVEVTFSGSLMDTDTANTCDSMGVDCVFLNDIGIRFDMTDPAGTATFLTLDSNPFFNVLPFLDTCPGGSILSDDSTGSAQFDLCTGPIFGIQVAPNTPIGVYTGSVSILGGYDDPGLNNVLGIQQFTVVVAPEPSAVVLAALGIAAIVLARRRAVV